jgi:hypothetical protein
MIRCEKNNLLQAILKQEKETIYVSAESRRNASVRALNKFSK